MLNLLRIKIFNIFVLFLVAVIMPVFADDSNPVKTVIQQGHLILDYDITPDGKYLVSTDGTSIALWDLEKRRIVKLISYANDDVIRCHPVNPQIVYVTKPDVVPMKRRKFVGLNLFTGEISDSIPGSELPRRNSYHEDYVFKYHNYSIKVKSRKGRIELGEISAYPNIFIYGDMDINLNDSLVAISGQYPIVWDIKKGRAESKIPFREYLKNDADLVWSEYYWLPPIPKYKSTPIRPGGTVDFHHGSKDTFLCRFNPDNTLWFGSYTHAFTNWDLSGNLLDSIPVERSGVPENQTDTTARNPVPLYAFSNYDNMFVAATYGGLYTSVNGKTLKYRNGYGDSQYRAIYDISRPFRDGCFATVHDNGMLNVAKFHKPKPCKTLLRASSPLLHVTVSPDENRLLAGGEMGALYEVPVDNPTGKIVYDTGLSKYARFEASAFLDNNRFVTGNNRGEVNFWTSGRTNPRSVNRNHFSGVKGMKLTHDHKFLISSDSQGGLTLWDAVKETPVVSAYAFNQGKDYLFLTPDNYYKGSKGAYNGVHFTRGLEIYPLEQFDLRFNRPDIVLARLGQPQSVTEPYRLAWLKRLKRMGYTEEMITAEIHAPEVTINNLRDIAVSTPDRFVKVDVSVKDSKYKLNKFFVNLNGVPLNGKNGKDITKRKSGKYNEVVDIELCEGVNRIEVFAINEHGAESYRKELNIVCNPQVKAQRRLFVAAVGVSEYADSRYNLEYASKDATDIINLIQTAVRNSSPHADKYSEVKTCLLTDNEFTRQGLENIKTFFAQAGRDDAVVLFYAGHGVLDNELNYYLSHYNINFEDPGSNGIAYDDFEGLLENSKAINRLCLIDACHSGEIDKDDYLAENVTKIESPLRFRAVGAGIRKSKGHGTEQTKTLFNELFVDIRWGVGATIISSAGGMEVAMEGDKWKNGVFTWCLKKGLTDRVADIDGDKRVSVAELGEYLCREVSSLTVGTQTPTMRAQNTHNDFYLIR